MKFLMIILIQLGFYTVLFSQTLDTSIVNYNESLNDPVVSEQNNNVDNTGFGVNTGASFSKVSGVGSFHSTYVSPYFDHKFKNNFTLRGGMTYLNSTINSGFQPYKEVANYNPNSQYVSLYAEGEYQFNEKLHITGAFQKSLDNSGMPNPYMLHYFDDMVSIGMYYNITKNLSIGAEFNIMNRNNSYGYFPYYSPISSPF